MRYPTFFAFAVMLLPIGLYLMLEQYKQRNLSKSDQILVFSGIVVTTLSLLQMLLACYSD